MNCRHCHKPIHIDPVREQYFGTRLAWVHEDHLATCFGFTTIPLVFATPDYQSDVANENKQ